MASAMNNDHLFFKSVLEIQYLALCGVIVFYNVNCGDFTVPLYISL